MRARVKPWTLALVALLLAVTGLSVLHGHAADCDDCVLGHAAADLDRVASTGVTLEFHAPLATEAPALVRRADRGGPRDRGPPAA